MERGFMKLWRKLKDSRCYSRGGVHRALLLTLFTEVNWKVGHFRGEIIGPGQIAISVVRLADELGFPRTTVRRALADLVKDGVIRVENVDNQWSRISFVNWSSYNNIPEECGQPMANQRPTSGQPTATIKELKKKEDMGEKRGAGEVLVPELVPAGAPVPSVPVAGAAPAGRVEQGRAAAPVPVRSAPAAPPPSSPRSFRPPTVEEVRAYCESRGNGLDAEAFVAFYQSNGWKVGRNPMQNWQAAVRTWESKRQEEARARAGAGAQAGGMARAGQSPRPSTVAQQRYAEQDMMARMLLTDRERRNHAQNRGHAADTHRPEPALPPGW